MNPIKKTVAAAKEFVQDHKVAIAITATAVVTTTVLLKLRSADIKNLNEFLDERGLTDEFYKPEA